MKLTEILLRQQFHMRQEAQNWPPEPRWWYISSESMEWKQVNLVNYASPQPVIVSLLSAAAISGNKVINCSLVFCLIAGTALMLFLPRRFGAKYGEA